MDIDAFFNSGGNVACDIKLENVFVKPSILPGTIDGFSVAIYNKRGESRPITILGNTMTSLFFPKIELDSLFLLISYGMVPLPDPLILYATKSTCHQVHGYKCTTLPARLIAGTPGTMIDPAKLRSFACEKCQGISSGYVQVPRKCPSCNAAPFLFKDIKTEIIELYVDYQRTARFHWDMHDYGTLPVQVMKGSGVDRGTDDYLSLNPREAVLFMMNFAELMPAKVLGPLNLDIRPEPRFNTRIMARMMLEKYAAQVPEMLPGKELVPREMIDASGNLEYRPAMPLPEDSRGF